MLSTVSQLAGGIGLFLLGMVLMTDGLRAAAGSSLQHRLARLTRGPHHALATGAGLTALVQSSSATTVAAIGFVSAGILTFPQAFGVIMGANIGTTSTGWIVALLGLKLKIGAITLPFVAVGVLMRLVDPGRRGQIGMAIAGFALIFVGIDVLKDGMTGLNARFDPASFPSASDPVGVVLLTGVGVVTTVIMQSSSAAVATTLTALHAGTLDMAQAVYLVVGQNIGTTITAAIAAAGASIPGRRTALGHILFNLVTGAIALGLLPFVLPYLLESVPLIGRGDMTLVIAGFHTAFNVLGVVVFLPFTAPFSRLIARLVPDAGPKLTRSLDRSMIEIPTVALTSAHTALRRLATAVLDPLIERLVREQSDAVSGSLDPDLDAAVIRVREFLGELSTGAAGQDEFDYHISLLHATDHMDRLLEASRESAHPAAAEATRAAADDLEEALRRATTWLRDGTDREGADVDVRLRELSARLADARRTHRAETLERTAASELSPALADERLHAMRWIDRVGYHTWRAVHHLATPATPDVH